MEIVSACQLLPFVDRNQRQRDSLLVRQWVLPMLDPSAFLVQRYSQSLDLRLLSSHQSRCGKGFCYVFSRTHNSLPLPQLSSCCPWLKFPWSCEFVFLYTSAWSLELDQYLVYWNGLDTAFSDDAWKPTFRTKRKTSYDIDTATRRKWPDAWTVTWSDPSPVIPHWPRGASLYSLYSSWLGYHCTCWVLLSVIDPFMNLKRVLRLACERLLINLTTWRSSCCKLWRLSDRGRSFVAWNWALLRLSITILRPSFAGKDIEASFCQAVLKRQYYTGKVRPDERFKLLPKDSHT